MSLGGVLLGIINIAIVVAVFVLIGLVILMFCNWAGFPIDARLQKVFMIIVALIALYMLVALLLGIPTLRVVGSNEGLVVGAVVPPPSTRILR